MLMSNDAWYRYYVPRRVAAMTAAGMVADRVAAEADIDAVLAQLALGPADRILEIGCGWGRHSLALAQRGFDNVLSIDIAPEPLTVARRLAEAEGVCCDFRQTSFCEVQEQGFDAILSLYDRSCCGFPTEGEDAASLHHLAVLLKPGGWLLFGINDWPFQMPEASQEWHEVEGGREFVEIIPDRVEMTCTHRVTLIRQDGRQQSYTLTRRHYYLPELRRLLAEAGFKLVAAGHRLGEQRPYGDGGDGLFVYAQLGEVDS
jgi:SAM-dependent methyltransferase